MGNKIITEKDFWMCTEGAIPSQLQGSREGTKDLDGNIYITVKDTATVASIDFGCKKYMWLAALAAAAAVLLAVVVGVLTVATGGLALIAMCAIAGVVGGTVAAVVGGLLCGHKMGPQRNWDNSKTEFISQGVNTITGDHKMICAAGGVVQFAPNITSWTGAIGMATLNYASELVKCAFIGAGAGTVGTLLGVGSVAVAGTGGTVGTGISLASRSAVLALPTFQSVGASIAASFGIGTGATGATIAVGSRVLFGSQNAASAYAMGDDQNIADSFAKGALPEYEMASRVHEKGFAGLQPTDALILLHLLNVKFDPKGTYRDSKGTLRNKRGNAEGKPPGSIATDPRNAPKPKKNGKAYEGDGIGTARAGAIAEEAAISKLKAEGYTDIVQVQNKSGHGVDVIGRNAKGEVKCVEVKANTSRLSEAQQGGGKKFVNDRLQRAVDGNGHYKIPPNSEQMKIDAQKAQEWIKDSPKTDYEVHRVPVDNTTGVAGDPVVSPWDPKP
jgi:Holliday junction resolvase-like predicted endonuclease